MFFSTVIDRSMFDFTPPTKAVTALKPDLLALTSDVEISIFSIGVPPLILIFRF
jgi:hypothetical protein